MQGYTAHRDDTRQTPLHLAPFRGLWGVHPVFVNPSESLVFKRRAKLAHLLPRRGIAIAEAPMRTPFPLGSFCASHTLHSHRVQSSSFGLVLPRTCNLKVEL